MQYLEAKSLEHKSSAAKNVWLTFGFRTASTELSMWCVEGIAVTYRVFPLAHFTTIQGAVRERDRLHRAISISRSRAAIKGVLSHLAADSIRHVFCLSEDSERLYRGMRQQFTWEVSGMGGLYDAPYDGPNAMVFDMQSLAASLRIDRPFYLLSFLVKAGIFVPETSLSMVAWCALTIELEERFGWVDAILINEEKNSQHFCREFLNKSRR